MSKIREKIFDFIMMIAQKRFVIGLPISIAMSVLYKYRILLDIKQGLPHVITLSTALLTVIGLVYSIIIVVQTKDIYKDLLETHDNAVKELHLLIQDSVLLCICVILISLALLLLNIPDIILLKITLSFLGMYFFIEMIITCAAAFLATTFLFQTDNSK